MTGELTQSSDAAPSFLPPIRAPARRWLTRATAAEGQPDSPRLAFLLCSVARATAPCMFDDCDEPAAYRTGMSGDLSTADIYAPPG
jgi:hypothetical protein